MRKEDYEEQLSQRSSLRMKKEIKKIIFIAISSAATVASFFVIYYGVKYNELIGYLLFILCFVILIIMVFLYKREAKKVLYLYSLEDTLNSYIDCYDESWKNFEETGEEFSLDENPTAKDLDIFGKYSLFQYICSAKTKKGKQRLANKLTNKTPNKELIHLQQKAISELAEKTEFSLSLQAHSGLVSNYMFRDGLIETFIESAQNIQGKSSYSRVKWLPMIWIGIVAVIFIAPDKMDSLKIAGVFAVVQSLITIIRDKKNEKVIQSVNTFYESIQSYRGIFLLMEQESFQSKYLNELKMKISGTESASKSIKSLGRIAFTMKSRFNPVSYLITSSLVLWDFWCIDAFSKWSKKHVEEIETWVDVVAEMEALISLSTLCNVKDDYCFAHIMDKEMDGVSLCFQDLKHPLIRESDSIGNDFNGGSSTNIITGSNMSGKTTFLRAIGMNLSLAYSGGPCLAKSLSVSELRIFTSMRIEDNVNEGISTFYAELLRIKEMVEYSELNLPMITLIDEIFKGTNSEDRIEGAFEANKRLAIPNAINFLTTHDQELGTLAQVDEQQYRNYHFREYYEDDEINFDYKIKEGVCTTRNAKYLLKMAGIIK